MMITVNIKVKVPLGTIVRTNNRRKLVIMGRAVAKNENKLGAKIVQRKQPKIIIVK